MERVVGKVGVFTFKVFVKTFLLFGLDILLVQPIVIIGKTEFVGNCLLYLDFNSVDLDGLAFFGKIGCTDGIAYECFTLLKLNAVVGCVNDREAVVLRECVSEVDLIIIYRKLTRLNDRRDR